MEGNPKAPKFLVEPHIEPPREAYVQHVRLFTWIILWTSSKVISLQPERKAWHPVSEIMTTRLRDLMRTILFLDYVAPSRVLLTGKLSWGKRLSFATWHHSLHFIYFQELPHKRIVRNVRKMLESKPTRVELENIFTALPRGSRPKRNYDDDSDWVLLNGKIVFSTFVWEMGK